MALSCLIAAANKEVSISQPLKCCVMTRMGGCQKDASKYKFQHLISKFELYNVEPPVLKEGYDGDTARICTDHNRLSPRKYHLEERPNGIYESTIELLEREDALVRYDPKQRGRAPIITDSDSDEWENSGDEANNEQVVMPIRSTRSTKMSPTRETKAKRAQTPPITQERHCIYLKVEDDEKCRAVAQKLGLARGTNGYNRSALLAKVPNIASENIQLRQQLLNMQEKVERLERSLPEVVPQRPALPAISTLMGDDVAHAAYDEINDRLSTLKQSEEPSWVHLLMNNLTEEEVMQIVNSYDGGRLKRKLLATFVKCEDKGEREVPNATQTITTLGAPISTMPWDDENIQQRRNKKMKIETCCQIRRSVVWREEV